jgi:hypothetical protein
MAKSIYKTMFIRRNIKMWGGNDPLFLGGGNNSYTRFERAKKLLCTHNICDICIVLVMSKENISVMMTSTKSHVTAMNKIAKTAEAKMDSTDTFL